MLHIFFGRHSAGVFKNPRRLIKEVSVSSCNNKITNITTKVLNSISFCWASPTISQYNRDVQCDCQRHPPRIPVQPNKSGSRSLLFLELARGATPRLNISVAANAAYALMIMNRNTL
ncbi:MAG: hypothetical protein ABI813_10675 [Bacteroidota bacterium]